MIDQVEIRQTKKRNIIEMALGFTATMRLFCKGSKARIETQLEQVFSDLDKIKNRADYETRHRQFCTWFVREIKTAAKKGKNGRGQECEAASYGHAAKILDIAIKVYVYYCRQPTEEMAQRLVPLLNGAADTPIMSHLKATHPKIRASTIKQLDRKGYLYLQSLVRAESLAHRIHPVQYDDVMWRRLNRRKAAREDL